MLSKLVKVISVYVILALSSGLALANKVGLDNVAARAWTDRDSNYVGLNTQICFRSTVVNNKKQKSNCVRLKSSISGVKQFEHIIFETKNTQFNFKTNNRSGTNIKFWLKERANEDTISIYSFLNQLNRSDIALVGAMCKKITEMKWLTTTVGRAIDRSNDIDPYVINRFKSAGYQDINRIAKRCQAAVEQRIGKIELVKFAASKVSKKRKECEYSKNKLYDMQSTLGYLDIYKSKVDGRYGPGTKKAIKIGKNKIFQFANRSSDCLSANELSWLKLLVSVKRKGKECKKFNSFEELKEIAKLLERIGRPVFSPFSAFDRVRYSDYDYRQVVYAIIEYENSLSDDYFKVAQRDRDCRIITLEKMALVEKAENNPSSTRDNQSAKLSEGNKGKDTSKEKKAEEELAKKEAEEALAKKKAEEELARKEAEEALAKKKAEEELAKKEAEEALAKKKAEEELAKKEAEEALAKKKAEEELAKKKLEEELARQRELRQRAKEALNNKIEVYTVESQSMISDIKTFMKTPNDFDVVKIAKLFVNFNNRANIKWHEETVNAYEELKKYVMSFDDFANFRQEQIAFRQEEKEKKIRTLKAEIKTNASIIKKFIAENIGSKDIEDAIKLLEIIEGKNGRDIQKLSVLKGDIRNFMLLNDLPFEEIEFPLADPKFKIDDKLEVKQKEKKLESIKKPKTTKASNFEQYFNNEFELTKEVGDGFTNFEASKDYLLFPFILNGSKRIKTKNKDIKDDEVFAFSFVIDKKKFEPNEEASEAFAAQQDLSDYFQNKGRYTVQTKKLAIVFNLLKRDLDNAECANVITVFEDSSFRLLKVKGFENCKFRSE